MTGSPSANSFQVTSVDGKLPWYSSTRRKSAAPPRKKPHFQHVARARADQLTIGQRYLPSAKR